MINFVFMNICLGFTFTLIISEQKGLLHIKSFELRKNFSKVVCMFDPLGLGALVGEMSPVFCPNNQEGHK